MKITMVSLAQNYLPKNIVCAFQKECPGKFDAFNPKDMTDKAFINSFDCKIHKKDSVFRILFSCYKLSYRITSYTNGTSFGGVSEKTYADSSSSFAGAKKEVSSV